MKKALPFIYLIVCFFANAQNERKADSLKLLLKRDNISDTLRAEILYDLIAKLSSPSEKWIYSDSLLMIDKMPSHYYIRAKLMKGLAQKLKGNLDTALAFYFEALEMSSYNDLKELEAETYLEIGTTYTSNNDHKNALLNFKQAIAIFRSLGKKQELAINLLNTGYTYYSMSHYDTALLYYNEAGPIFDSLGLRIGQAYNLGNRALVFWKMRKMAAAERGLLTAISMLESLGDQYGMAEYHNKIGNLYLEQGLLDRATSHLKDGLSIALEIDLKEQIRDASLILSRLNASLQDFDQAYRYHKQYVAYKDSVQNKEVTMRMADLRTKFEVSLKEKEIDLLEKDKNLHRIYIAISVVLLMFFIVLYFLNRQRMKAQNLLTSAERSAHDQQIREILQSQERKALESMIQGRDKERKHLAHELHNHLGSMLATIKINLNGMSEESKRVQTLHELVDQIYADVRGLSHTLNMGVAEDFGLVSALQELADSLSKSGKIAVEFNAVMENCIISFENEIVIYRIVQELTSNVLKHAQATEMAILLTCFSNDDIINIMVSDNGKGIDFAKSTAKSDGIGLKALQRMIQRLQGEYQIDTHPSKGTTVNIDLPLPQLSNTI